MTNIFDTLHTGDVVAEHEYNLTRDSLVRYAGASGDFNPIHYRDDIAKEVGLEGVLAHGMLTMGVATSIVSDWLGTNGFVLDTQARFTRPVIVDPAQGADLTLKATINELNAENKTATVKVEAVFEGKTVLNKALIVVQFI